MVSIRKASSTKEAKKKSSGHLKSTTIPDSFSLLDTQTSCIQPVRSQGNCGSCYSFAAAQMLGDRYCIATGGDIKVRLTMQELVSCDYNNYGCNGGWMTNAILYMQNYGLYTTFCMPYDEETTVTKKCKYRCDDMNIKDNKYFCKQGSMKILTDVEDI